MAEHVLVKSDGQKIVAARRNRVGHDFRMPRLTLRDKIIGTISIAILVPVLLMGVFGAYTSEKGARANAWRDALIGGRAARAIVEEQGNQLESTAEALALDPRFGDAVARDDWSELLALASDASYQLNGLDVTVTDEAGRVLIRTSDPGRNGDRLADSLDGLRVALRGQSNKTMEQAGYLGLALRGFAPIRRDGRTIGALVVGRRADDGYMGTISQVSGLMSFALRMDGSGVGATVDPGLANAIERSSGTYAGFGTVNGTLRAVYAWRFDGSADSANSYLAVASPDLNIAQDRLTQFWTTMAMVILGVVTTILLSWLFTRMVIRPIEKISNAAQQIASGAGREIPLIATKDELEGLSRSIGKMVTALSERNQQLDRLHHRIELILSSAGDGIFDQGRDGRSTFVNLTAARLTGYGVDEMIGQSMHELLHHSRADGTAYPCADCPSCSVVRDGEARRTIGEVFWRKDGTSFPVEYTTTPIVEAGEVVGAVVTFRDVTERRVVEKMKDEFISVVSHELRTPLTSIRGSLGLLASGMLGDLPDRGKRMLEIAVKNTDRLVRLINDILDIERIESGKVTMDKHACDASELISQASEVMRALADSAEVRIETRSEPARLFVDSDRVIQVLTNLLSNAIKFSPRGGRVLVTGERRPEGFLFRVSDQGRGIPRDKLDTIFERFQQIDASDSREKGGAGLGLAICRSIVIQHGGRIWAESVPGEGSTFFAAFPVVEDAANAQIPSVEPPPRQAILVCDDDPLIRRVVASLLEQRGHRALTAASGDEAVDVAAAERPAAILLDVLMPGMNGWETMSALQEREETKGIPVVIFSRLEPEERPSTALQPAAWVDKRADSRRLVEVLESAAAGTRRMARVLVVEDDIDLAHVLITSFERRGIETFHASTGREAIHLSEILTPDLIVLDVILPDGDGYDVVDWLRSRDRMRGISLVVYSASEVDEGDRDRLRLGYTEFQTKGRIAPEEFEQRIVTLLEQIIARGWEDNAHVGATDPGHRR